MRILLRPGDELIIGCYEKKDEEDGMPLEHGLLDGQFFMRFSEAGKITIETEWPDNQGRKGVIYSEDSIDEVTDGKQIPFVIEPADVPPDAGEEPITGQVLV